jgi:hypothetical protein
LDFIREIRPVKFTWNLRNTDETHPRFNAPDSGFIAQELAETANKYQASDWLKVATGEGTDQMFADPGRLLPVTIRAVQELADQVDTLRAKVHTLEEKIQLLSS